MLALFQQIQSLADDQVNSTYSDRYYGAASTSPANVLPRVFKTARHRVRQIRSFALKRDLLALLNRVHWEIQDRFPRFLNVAQQGEFQLGYFHQMATAPRDQARVRLITRKGDVVKSHGERLIADLLHRMNVPYEYEQPKLPFTRRNGKADELSPDFCVRDALLNRSLWIEYQGMSGDEDYDRAWKVWKEPYYRRDQKVQFYEDLTASNQVEPEERVLWVIPPEATSGRSLFQDELEGVLRRIFGKIPQHGDETTPF